MLPAVPLPVVLSQMTRPDVEHLCVAEALPGAASEAVAAIVAADARTAAPVSTTVRLTRRPRVDVVRLAAERHHHLAALADDLATDATVLQHKPSARLPVVITRCG